MAVQPTRVRRLRIRKAIGRVVMTACVVAGAMFYLEVRGGASESGVQTPVARSIEASPAGGVASAAPASDDVGVWAVEATPGSSESSDAPVVAQGQGPTRTVRVVVQGKDHHMRTNAATVGQLLSAMGIEPDANDRVTPSPRTPLHSGRLVRYVDVTFKVVEQRAALPAPTHTTFTTKLDPGKQKVLRQGRNGRVLKTYRRELQDGKLVKKKLIKTHVLVQPRAEVREVGQAPAPATTSGSGSSSGGSGHVLVGEASWYNHPGLTAASPNLPFGTQVHVTNVKTGASVTVTINDRGPYTGGRIIDLSNSAFAAISPLGAGVCQVRLTW